ncbi:hypothetical protein [Methanocaldococcus sp.]
MKIRKLILLFFSFFFVIQLIYAQNETTNITTTIPTEKFGEIHLSYYIVGEITNLNPYSVFIAIPDGNINIETSNTLPIPSSGVIQATINTSNNITYYLLKPSSLTEFNKKLGFWLPPYTTTKIKLAVYDYNMTININAPKEYNFRVIGPAVVNTYKVISIKDMFPKALEEHIRLNNFKLYVYGYLEIYNEPILNENESIMSSGSSLILPLPLAFKNYKDIQIVNDNGIWINYYDWYNNFINITINNNEIKNYDSDFDPTLTNDVLLGNLNINRYFPAMAFTVSDSSGKIKFYYTVDWKENNSIKLPDFI